MISVDCIRNALERIDMATHLHFYRLVVGDLVVTSNSTVEPNSLFVLVLPILDHELREPRDLLCFQLAGTVVFDVRTKN